MTPKETAEELRRVQKRYKDAFTGTGSINISDMAADAASAIEDLQRVVDVVYSMNSCNTCDREECEYFPDLGGDCRLNCPLHIQNKEHSMDNPTGFRPLYVTDRPDQWPMTIKKERV
jgi:hypothetical protein